jgi:hypothetical protein
MKKLVTLLLTAFITLGFVASTASADAGKGQKLYLKKLKKHFGYNGVKFCAQHTQDEWEELFANDAAGFIKAYGDKHPSAQKFLNSDKFKTKLAPHIKDFAIEYASDSGNVPSC